jgi:hypothetical protein
MAYSVPGVFFEPQPRAQPQPLPRTDVAGFIGFENRVREASAPSLLLGTPPIGHEFRIDVAGFEVELAGRRAKVPATDGLLLSMDSQRIPMAPGGSISYAVAALDRGGPTLQLVVVPGRPSPLPRPLPATDDELRQSLPGPFVRLADVELRRTVAGDAVLPTVIPALPPTRCDDHRDFALRFGVPGDDDGTLLSRAVRAYLANGGARCWVQTVRRPRLDDAEGLQAAVEAMVGVRGAGERAATGLERLLLVEEVAFVDVPDLYAQRVDVVVKRERLPPRNVEACFRSCSDTFGPVTVESHGRRQAYEPVFSDAQVLEAQRAMILRCAADRWRVLLLLTAPVAFDPTDGAFHGPSVERALDWRDRLDGAVGDREMACAAFYFPWLWAQERLGADILELPPTPFAAGVIARRDLARGPHVAPANETLIGVVALTRAVDDEANARLYDRHINPIRPFPGFGIQVWGARTLSSDDWLRFLPVRRCLSAIERRVFAAVRPLVFEPNNALLWFQLRQAITGVLLPIAASGALRGDGRDQSFYVRCDAENNPPETVALGQVVIECGVAVAAPAEFIVFRVGRREGVVEVLEQT